MNWAYMRAEGIVTRQPALDPETGSLKFWMSDDTGEILVIAYRDQAKALLEASLVPVMGDRVALEGTLRVKDDFQYLVLEVPEHTEVHSPEPMDIPIGGIHSGLLHQKVRVRGTVRADRLPYEGLRILTLRDATGAIDVTLVTGSRSPFALAPDVEPGQAVVVVGAVDQYEGTPQISLARGSDLVPLDAPLTIAPVQPIGHLSRAGVGSMAAVEGRISRVSRFSAGTKCTLDDGTGTVTILLWQDLYDSLASGDDLVAGTAVHVEGRLAEYGGELEIVPEIASDLSVLGAGEIAIPQVQLAELRPGDVGRYLQVTGVLHSLDAFSAGVQGKLDDGTGTVTLLLWQDLVDRLDDRHLLAPGAELSVRGKIAEYQGRLELVPQMAADICVVNPAPTPTDTPLPSATPTSSATSTATPTATSQPGIDLAVQPLASPSSPTAVPSPSPPSPETQTPAPEVRTIGSISNADVGLTLTIDGAGIASLDFFSRGVKYTLNDGSGTITLLIWQDLIEEIPLRYDLVPGSQVVITGLIEEYEGDLEIIPQAGSGVRLLNAGQRLPLEERHAGEITPSDEGRIFAVEGAVNRTESDGWLKLWLRDDSGEILIFVPQRTVPYLPVGLAPGARLRVTGEVEIYGGSLEIIPLAAADVEVR
jgi:DNA/RNA endonuclease YhcR with UshA esterase domain